MQGIIGSLLFYVALVVVIVLLTEGTYYYHQWKVGDQIIVSVIDSGIDATHPAFKDKLIYPYDILDWDKKPEDTSGHGTHMASMITQIAPNTRIMPVRTLGDEKKKYPFFSTGLSVLYSVVRGADVVNMSYIEPETKMTKFAIWYGRKKGVIFVSSAGNEGKDTLHYPAKAKGVISVAAVDKKDRLYKNSNIGEETQFATQGVNIAGADYEWATKKDLLVDKTGTSISSAYLSGIIAYLLEQDPKQSQKDIEETLKKYSHALYDDSERPTEKLKVVQLDKIKAAYEENPYVHILTNETNTKEHKLTITIDTLNADTLTVLDAKGNYTLDAKDSVEVETMLVEGYNYIQAKISKKEEEFIDSTYLLRDTTPPIIDYYGVIEENGAFYHLAWITDYEIKHLEVNGSDAKERLIQVLGQKPYALHTYTLLLPVTTKKIHIHAQDSAGLTTNKVIKK